VISDIVISLSKIRDRDWSYTRHVIRTNNHCWPVQRCSGQHYRSTLPAGRHPMTALRQHYTTSGHNFSVLTSAAVNICIVQNYAIYTQIKLIAGCCRYSWKQSQL